MQYLGLSNSAGNDSPNKPTPDFMSMRPTISAKFQAEVQQEPTYKDNMKLVFESTEYALYENKSGEYYNKFNSAQRLKALSHAEKYATGFTLLNHDEISQDEYDKRWNIVSQDLREYYRLYIASKNLPTPAATDWATQNKDLLLYGGIGLAALLILYMATKKKKGKKK